MHICAVDGTMWCLLSIAPPGSGSQLQLYSMGGEDDKATSASGDDSNNASGSAGSEGEPGAEGSTAEGAERKASEEGSSSSGKAAGYVCFWTKQSTYLAKRREAKAKKLAEITGAPQPSEGNSADALREAKEAAATGAKNRFCIALSFALHCETGTVTLADGTVLPETVDAEITRRLNARFDKKWKSSSRHFERTAAELVRSTLRSYHCVDLALTQTARVQTAEADLAKVTEEYSQYKRRAANVLKQQNVELVKANKDTQDVAQLQQAYDSMRDKNRQLEAEVRWSSESAFLTCDSRRTQIIKYEAEREVLSSLRRELERLQLDNNALVQENEKQAKELRAQLVDFEQKLKDASAAHERGSFTQKRLSSDEMFAEQRSKR